MTSEFPEYPKISGPYNRHTEGPDRNKLIIGQWSKPEFADLASIDWEWTEKVDGTNIRILWDGHKVTYGGRTDNAQIPAKLIAALDELFKEELFEQAFGADSVVLYGEGYGAGIQKGGGNYRDDQSFVLFDVLIGNWWLMREGVEVIADKLGVDIVPSVTTCPVQEAIDMVSRGLLAKWTVDGAPYVAEGLVGRPPSRLLSRDGKPIMMKIKAKDFSA